MQVLDTFNRFLVMKFKLARHLVFSRNILIRIYNGNKKWKSSMIAPQTRTGPCYKIQIKHDIDAVFFVGAISSTFSMRASPTSWDAAGFSRAIIM